MVAAATNLVCSNCGGSDTAAVVAAVASAVAAIVTLGIAFATFKTAGATGKAAEATTRATEATRDAATATNRAADAAADEAKATLKEADATLELVGLSREQIQGAYRPLVVPVIDYVGASSKPRVEGDFLRVPLKNIGSGPALNVELSVRGRTGALAGLGASDVMWIAVHAAGLDGLADFDLSVTYEDLAHEQWTTTARYDHRDLGRHVDVKIKSSWG